MLYHFLKNMLNILRLRYKHPAEYTYPLPVILAVLLLLGMINAAAMSALFGKDAAAVVFSILLTAVKWLILSRTMSAVLHYYGAPRLPLQGFTLASEALNIPMLLVLYVPQLSPLGLLWQIWAFWTQAIGYMKMGNVAGWKVAVGYIAYFICTLIAGSALLMLFTHLGWMNEEMLRHQLQTILQQQK